MKGTAFSEPTPHIRWSNNSRSEMPTWQVARECAIASRALAVLIEVRSALWLFQREALTEERADELLEMVKALIDEGRHGIDQPSPHGIEPQAPRGFPVPPGAIKSER
jgi:hypothetical protein